MPIRSLRGWDLRDYRIERNNTIIYSGIFVDILFMDQLTLAWVDFPLHYFNLWIFEVDPHQENGNILFGTLRHLLILSNALGGFFYLLLLSKISKSSYK